MNYEVKDAEGNVVATFSTEAAGPFTVTPAEGGGSQPEGGGGPGEEH